MFCSLICGFLRVLLPAFSFSWPVCCSTYCLRWQPIFPWPTASKNLVNIFRLSTFSCFSRLAESALFCPHFLSFHQKFSRGAWASFAMPLCVSLSLCLHRIGSAGNLFACRSGLAPWSMLYKLNINRLHGKSFDFIWRSSLLCILADDT